MELKTLPIPKRYFTEAQAVEYTTMSRVTLKEARDLNVLPYRRYGKKIIYERIHLDAWVDSFELHINGIIKNKENRRVT